MLKNFRSSFPILGLIIWSLAALFFLYEFFLRTFVGSVANQVIPDLNLNAETFSIIGSAYYIAYGAMQVPVGILADKFGVKRIMIFATLLCAGSTFLFAHATGFYTAFLSRLLMGFGSSFAFICLLVVAVTWFPRKNFAFFAGSSQFIGTMGPLLAGGPFIALMARFHTTWRVALSAIGIAGVILTILTILIVKNKPRDAETTLIYLKQEATLSDRLRRLVQNNQAWLVAAYSATVYISLALLGAIWGTAYLQALGFSQKTAAYIVSFAWLGNAVGCPLLGAISDTIKRRKPLLIFCGLLGLFTTIGIVYLPIAHLSWVYGLLFFCLGMAAAGQNIGFAAISEHVDLATRATALGLNNGSMTLFAAIIPPIVSYFIFLSARGNDHHLQYHNFVLGFSIMPILYISSVILALFFIKETYCRPQKEMIILKVKP